MDLLEALQILAEVRFPLYVFRVHGDFGGVRSSTYLQAEFTANDNDDPRAWHVHKTRKWLLSPHMTRSELVQTAFKCVLTSVEHEAREQFTYRGARVFGPHFDVDVLAGLHSVDALDTRKEPA